jgi:RNA-directed DNA polymerase
VTQDPRGKQTAGLEGVNALRPPQRWPLARALPLEGNATPRRRPWMPTRGRPEKRPRGIPTPHERARQTLVRQAVEPAGEATLAPHPDGFRPGRSCGEAIAAVCPRITVRPPYRLKVESAKGVDRLAHQALWAKLPAPPGLRRHVRGWRRSGSRDDDVVGPTTAGTPPGGSGSPLLARIALPGRDTASTQVYPEAGVMADADDGVGLQEERAVVDHGQPLVMTWRAASGLTRNVTKTPIRHPWAGEQPGMDSLGFPLRH